MDLDTIPAGQFKAHCLKLLDDVSDNRRSLLITKHGKPVAKVMPVDKKPRKLFGCMKDSVIINGDIVSSHSQLWNLPE